MVMKLNIKIIKNRLCLLEFEFFEVTMMGPVILCLLTFMFAMEAR